PTQMGGTMAERTVIVCDTCGGPAAERISIRVGGRSLQKDLCATHVAELLQGANPARRGRRPTLIAPTLSPKRPGRPSTTASSATAKGSAGVASRGRARKTASAKRRGAPSGGRGTGTAGTAAKVQRPRKR